MRAQKMNWHVGDVRGIKKISIAGPTATNLWLLKYRLTYFTMTGIASVSFIALQRRQTRVTYALDEQLAETNEFLTSASPKTAR